MKSNKPKSHNAVKVDCSDNSEDIRERTKTNSNSTSKYVKQYTLGEEIFNSVTHGAGSLLAIAGTVVLLVFSVIYGDAWCVVSAAIYGFTLICLYTMSTLYHSITHVNAKHFFRIMDHNTIFILIAGTYTPYMLVTLHGTFGWTILGIIWGTAAIGITLNSIDLEKFRKPSVVLYLIMGWAIVFAIPSLINNFGNSSLALVFLMVGGIFYTVGIVFYAIKKIKYFHSIWHLFTIGGSIFHYFSIFIALTNQRHI
ncbi:MAG: hemolysin III family protein [Bacillota bacterium]|nr:hemolysin III family protein [Bacillota bacterium]